MRKKTLKANCGVNSNREFQTLSLSKQLEAEYLLARMREAEDRRLKRLSQVEERKKVLAEIEALRGTPVPK